jgi:hypothetical protein
MRNAYRIEVESLERRDHSEDPGIDGRIILKSYRIKMGGCGLNLSGSGYRSLEDSCKHGDEPSVSVKIF